MISKELQEKLIAKYNPEGSELRRLQNHLLIILAKFDAFCREHNIKYWLSSGTCLGAVRHGGFIPWDDDIDIEMERKDFLRFAKLWKDDDDFVLQSYKNDLYYTEPFPKLRLRNTYVQEGEGPRAKLYDYKGIFLDIFIMERSNVHIAKLCHFIIGSLRHMGFHFNKGKVQDVFFSVIKKMCFGIVHSLRIFNWFSSKNLMRHTLGTGVEKNVRDRHEILPLVTMKFEGKLYPVPHNYDAYLKRMFGNYNQIPEVIHTHVLKNVQLLPDDDYNRLLEQFE